MSNSSSVLTPKTIKDFTIVYNPTNIDSSSSIQNQFYFNSKSVLVLN